MNSIDNGCHSNPTVWYSSEISRPYKIFSIVPVPLESVLLSDRDPLSVKQELVGSLHVASHPVTVTHRFTLQIQPRSCSSSSSGNSQPAVPPLKHVQCGREGLRQSVVVSFIKLNVLHPD